MYFFKSWCSNEPSNFNVTGRLHNGCSYFDLQRSCLVNTPCRLGELDSIIQSNVDQFVCQYSVNNSKPLITLPTVFNTLESGFVLHKNEFLLSSNKNYKLILQSNRNLVVLVNFFSFFFLI